MKQILVFGAGKSATSLLEYLLHHAIDEEWQVIVVDANIELARQKIGSSTYGIAVSFDIHKAAEREQYIQASALVISMLPPSLHSIVAMDCVKFSRHLLTASYIDDSIRALAPAIEQRGLLFLCEMGLDPGIDHMSAMQLIDDIHAKGGQIITFRSHCGGLIAPESDDNPWHYKISWNPRNIILAGKSGAYYKEQGQEIKLDYAQLFDPGRRVDVPGIGMYGWYPNRDSLSYAALYHLQDTENLVRTTLRHPDFMSGWKHIVDMQLTDETPRYDTNGRSLKSVFREHLDVHGLTTWWLSLPGDLTSQQSNLLLSQLLYLGFDDDETIVHLGHCSAADILQFAAERALALRDGDKDMIIMLHELEYILKGKKHSITSSLVVKGSDPLHTAMAKTVGLPLGIAAKLLLQGSLSLRGLHIPVHQAIYEPVLKELQSQGIRFDEIHS